VQYGKLETYIEKRMGHIALTLEEHQKNSLEYKNFQDVQSATVLLDKKKNNIKAVPDTPKLADNLDNSCYV
jgi:hypothetical protein